MFVAINIKKEREGEKGGRERQRETDIQIDTHTARIHSRSISISDTGDLRPLGLFQAKTLFTLAGNVEWESLSSLVAGRRVESASDLVADTDRRVYTLADT